MKSQSNKNIAIFENEQPSMPKLPWNVKLLRFLTGDNLKNSTTKIKGSFFAVIIGLILGMIPILIANGNPLFGYWLMISGPFSETAFRRTITIISVFIILGAGIGVSFKTGLFNIGATGQFLMAGMICVILGINNFTTFASIGKPAALFILVLISMIVGALTALIPAILKAFFNVHEVVTTILLNWVIFFIVRWIVTLPGIVGADGTATLEVSANAQFSLAANSFDYIIIFIIAIFMCLGLFVIFKYTNFGYVLRLNGLSPTAAKYSGINTRINILYSLLISGAFAGLAGFIFYSSVEQVVPRLDILPTIGFEALTVTLLAFSSPIGAIFSGFFYGLLYQGRNFMQIGAGGNVVRETALLTLGIIIFMSALAAILVRLYPLKFLNNHYRISQSQKIKKLKRQYYNEKTLLMDYYDGLINKYKIDYKKQKQKYKILKSQWVDEINQINQNYQTNQITILEKDYQINYLDDKYNKEIKAHDLLAYQQTIKKRKIAKQEIAKKYQFLFKKMLIDFQTELLIIKQKKRESLIKLNSKAIDQKNRINLKQKIIQKYYKQRHNVIKSWKDGQ